MGKKELQNQAKLHLLRSIKNDFVATQGTRDLIVLYKTAEKSKDCLDRDYNFLKALESLDESYRCLFNAIEFATKQLTK
jgi:hypothetical protein